MSPKFPCKQIPTDYVPEKQVPVDEGMIVLKGQLIFKVYVPNKPHRYGIKASLVSECSSGYICNMEMYIGKSQSVKNLVL